MYQKILLSEKISESIIAAIKNGFYKSGDQMPNELQLSEELGVSRATLREAVKILISKNILEVRRGIGTFVSEVPGFSAEAFGLDFIDLSTQIIDIQRSMRYLDSEELTSYNHLSFDDQKMINQTLLKVDKAPRAMLDALLMSTENIATYRHCSFKNRIILLSHEAFKRAIDLKNITHDAVLESIYEEFLNTISEEKVLTHYDDFIARIRYLAQEA